MYYRTAGFHFQKPSVCFTTVAIQSLPVENQREHKKKIKNNKKKGLKTLKSRQLERAAGSQAAYTFKYATLQTGDTRVILSL